MKPVDPGNRVRALNVQRIELEKQNQELRRAWIEENAALKRFADFYDFSPVGFFSLRPDGTIFQTNLTGARLLGDVRERLVGRHLQHFVAATDQSLLDGFLRAVFAGEEKQTCELALAIEGQPARTVQINAMLTPGQQECRAAVLDITRRKLNEEKLRAMAASLETQVAGRTLQIRRLSAQLTMAEERERRKLAQELHDDLGQLLAVIKIKLTSLTTGPHQPLIDQIVALVDQSERSARMITLELSPPVLHTLGLGPALDWLGDEIARIYGVNVRVKYVICPNGMAEEIQALLYRAARELLINVAKHAGISEAKLAYRCNGGQLTLVICDAGCGFEPADHFGEWGGHKNFGLRSIYERITNFGGRMVVDSSPGNGATVTLTIPCGNLAKERCDGSHYSG